MGGSEVEMYPTTSESAGEKVSEFLLSINPYDPNNIGVCIVGYGNMVTTVINELIKQEFKGIIVCSSTLTEKDWQPRDRSLDNQIFTVLPRFKDLPSSLAQDNKDVVFFFSKETLNRVLNITSSDSDPRNFLDHWQNQPADTDPFEQNMLVNGDCIINLDVITSEKWRQ
jgi:hypothetical protein